MAIAQTTVVAHVRLLGVCPNLVLLMTASAALLAGTRAGVLVALAGGIILDALGAAPFGAGTIALLAVALVTGVVEVNAFASIQGLPYLSAAVGTLLYNVLFLAILGIGGRAPEWGLALWRIVLPMVLVNSLAMLPVHGLASWVRGKVRPRPVEWGA